MVDPFNMDRPYWNEACEKVTPHISSLVEIKMIWI